MRSSFVDPTDSVRTASGRGVSRAGAIIAGIAVVIASFVIMGIALAAIGRTDDQSGDLRRNILENAFYLTKVQAQMLAIADYTPSGTPEEVRRKLNRLRFPLSAHMGMYFRPELQQAMLEEVSLPAGDLRKLRASSSQMWSLYLELRSTLERAALSPDQGEQASLMRDARRVIDAWFPVARRYNDALFVVQATVLARLERRVAISSRVAIGMGALALVATLLLVAFLTRWMVRERRYRHELEAARKEAERANHAKSVFLATLSHELRTPLHGMFGLMELLDREGLGESQRRHLRLLRTTTGGLLHQVEGLLDLSAVEAGEVKPRLAPVRLRESLAGAVESVRGAAATAGLRFSVAWPEDDRPRMLDSVRVGQIVTNLASNAVKYTPEGFVDISLALVEETLTIVVCDSGIGIGEADRERIFEMFVQADEGYTRSHGGTGAGLAIVRRLVDALGGEIGLESHPGSGSVFTVTIPAPLSDDSGPPAATDAAIGPANLEIERDDGDGSGADETPAGHRGVRVLVAEDEAINRLYLRMVLERNGFTVTEVGTGPAALDALNAGGFEVGLLDISMPGMSGLDVVRHIRAADAAAHRSSIPLVALTAHAQAEDRRACLDAGFDDYLTKPFDEQTLVARIGALLAGAPAR